MTKVNIRSVEAEEIEEHSEKILSGAHGILVPAVSVRADRGKIAAARFARERKIPISVSVWECRLRWELHAMCSLPGAQFGDDPGCASPVIHLMKSRCE